MSDTGSNILGGSKPTSVKSIIKLGEDAKYSEGKTAQELEIRANQLAQERGKEQDTIVEKTLKIYIEN